jgi:BirA family biotin operon repressor/biotin-[acetyl-CoA-carboxylase] ligase
MLRRLMEDRLQPMILRFETLDSTNLEAMRQARAGAREGLCIVAREQTSGRGRLDRSWQSPRDAGLYFSIILRPRFAKSSWPLITLMAALAVSDALLRACGVRVDIKWPNDICVNDRKLCGILVETTDTESDAAAIVGVGINLNSDTLAAELSTTATSVEEASGHHVDSELVLQELTKAITERYEFLYNTQGDEHTIREWCASSSYAFDRRVSVTLLRDTFEGVTRGLESDGALRVETSDGKIRIVRAGDVTALRPSI